MPEQEDRLIRCFASIFPELTREEILHVSTESAGTWDSLSTVTLAAVIQQEFDVEIDSDVLSSLESFEAFQTYLDRINAAGK